MKYILRTLLCKALITTMLLAAGFSLARAEQQTIHERMLHHRAIDAVVWAMPLLNFKKARDAHAALGVGPNDVAYYSTIQRRTGARLLLLDLSIII